MNMCMCVYSTNIHILLQTIVSVCLSTLWLSLPMYVCVYDSSGPMYSLRRCLSYTETLFKLNNVYLKKRYPRPNRYWSACVQHLARSITFHGTPQIYHTITSSPKAEWTSPRYRSFKALSAICSFVHVCFTIYLTYFQNRTVVGFKIWNETRRWFFPFVFLDVIRKIQFAKLLFIFLVRKRL